MILDYIFFLKKQVHFIKIIERVKMSNSNTALWWIVQQDFKETSEIRHPVGSVLQSNFNNFKLFCVSDSRSSCRIWHNTSQYSFTLFSLVYNYIKIRIVLLTLELAFYIYRGSRGSESRSHPCCIRMCLQEPIIDKPEKPQTSALKRVFFAFHKFSQDQLS